MMDSAGVTAGVRQDRAWSLAAVALTVVAVIEALLFRDTWVSLYRTWVSTDTYIYGLIIPLISAVLLYRTRKQWLPMRPVPSFLGVVATGTASLIWAVGSLSGIQTLQHFGVLALIPAAALSLFGIRVMTVVAFPFIYVLLATPFGEFLVPSLISWTADFSVRALELLGVPVFRDGPYIRIPAGDFHVVKACSGIRYLLTSVVLGVLFASFGFRSWFRRMAFMMLCVAAPVVANWIRATCIILIGHLSNMKLAAGIDHFIYGWVFFGVVMLVIFLIGSRFSDGYPKQASPPAGLVEKKSGILSLIMVVAGVAAAAASGSFIEAASANRAAGAEAGVAGRVVLPEPAAGWQRRDQPVTDWQPVFVGARSVELAGYVKGEYGISAIVVYYDTQTQGAEIVGAQNSMYDMSSWWLRFDRTHREPESGGHAGYVVREISVNDGQRNRLFWSWYSIAGTVYADEFKAKLATIRTVLSGRPVDSYLVALSVDHLDDFALARGAMSEFMAAHADAFSPCDGFNSCD